MIKRIISILITIPFIIYISGCATITGPSVSSKEIERAREELRVKSLAYRIKQLQRLHNIGTRLMLNIPKEDIKYPPQIFLGIVCLEIDKYLQRLYNLSVKRGLVIVVVKEKSPAADIGLVPADVLLSLNRIRLNNLYDLNAVISNLKIQETVEIEILRANQPMLFHTRIKEIPINCPIIMVDSGEVNAATDGKIIAVTYGLVNFAKSDDEIAAVLGHELAHAVRGHILKAQEGQIISFLAALALGTLAESKSPGSGEAVLRGVGQIGDIFNASYSRDLEREADYFGTRFVYFAGFDVDTCATVEERFAIEMPATMTQSYFSTHPSSPERVARIRKIIQELKEGRFSNQSRTVPERLENRP